jgi:hypothetical protein
MRLTFKCDYNWIIGLGDGGVGGVGGLNEIFLQTKSFRVNPGLFGAVLAHYFLPSFNEF